MVEKGKEKLLILGAGGHSRVVIEIALQNNFEIIGIIDVEFKGNFQEKIMGYSVLGGLDLLNQFNTGIFVFVALGDNKEREKYYLRQKQLGYKQCSLIHQTAIVSNYAEIGNGTIVNAGSIINALCKIGENTIINSGSIIEHETIIEDHVHIAPGVNIAGRCKIGQGTFIGIGTSVIDKIIIGENCIIGAGSIVVKNIPSNTTSYGCPARIIKQEGK